MVELMWMKMLMVLIRDMPSTHFLFFVSSDWTTYHLPEMTKCHNDVNFLKIVWKRPLTEGLRTILV